MPVPLIITGSSAASGTSLTTCRNRLAETLGHHGTGTITTLAASLEADKLLISTSYQSDQKGREHLDGLYVYVRSGDEARSSRCVVNGAFDGPIGAIMVDQPYESGPLAVGTAFEVSVLPGEKYMGAEGLNHIIFLALEDLPALDFVSMTAVADQTEYSLAGYPWPVKRIIDVIYPRTSTTDERRREVPRGQWSFVNNAELPVLSFSSLPFNPGDTFEIALHRPASTWIKTSGVWGDSTAGLVNEDDECLYDAATVVRTARPIALRRMALLLDRGSKERASLEGEAMAEEETAAIARLYSRFRGSGAQRIGASRQTGRGGTWSG